ncbi:unnamed protein product [Staurois parvus]|uniref:Uncharacterized protein n=1 Tax=Staurois parvus TaxID=386267 RepID=A0ABN9GC37_9NEOB|nr:unnamed protein product [Staurois parvus]
MLDSTSMETATR